MRWIAALGILAACQRHEAPRGHEIAMRNLAFDPDSLVVAVGDTVAWTNFDVLPHTVTSESHAWDSGSMSAAAGWHMVVSEPGTQAYICTFHPTMRGTLVVR